MAGHCQTVLDRVNNSPRRRLPLEVTRMLSRRRALIGFAAFLLGGQSLSAADSGASPDTAFLKGLEGEWRTSCCPYRLGGACRISR
jgi:hypothetical protein